MYWVRNMKKNRPICLLLCFALLLTLIPRAFAAEPDQTSTGEAADSTGGTTEPQPTPPPGTIPPLDPNAGYNLDVTNGCHSPDAASPMRTEVLSGTAHAALLYDENSNTMIYGWNLDLKVDPSSLTKIMTSLVALDRMDPAEEITVTNAALEHVPEDALVLGLRAGETLTLEQLLYCLMVYSANDAALVIAEAVGGSEGTFVTWMNDKARELGCTGTNFVNCHGIYDAMQYSTARDLLKMLLAALAYPVFRTVYATYHYELPGNEVFPESRQLYTTNYMLSDLGPEGYYVTRTTGGKTGITGDGRHSVVVSAADEGLGLIAFILEAEAEIDENDYVVSFREFDEAEALLNMGFDSYIYTQIVYQGQVLGQYQVTNGENALAIGAGRSVSAVLPKGAKTQDLVFRYQQGNQQLTAPVTKGQRVDILQIWYGSVCVAQTEVLAMNSVRLRTQAQDLNGPGQEGDAVTRGLLFAGALVVIILALVGLLYLIRAVRVAAYRSRRRKRRQSRRRSR